MPIPFGNPCSLGYTAADGTHESFDAVDIATTDGINELIAHLVEARDNGYTELQFNGS